MPSQQAHPDRGKQAGGDPGGHRFSVIVLLATAVSMLGADLLTKHLAFERVAGRPVVLSRENAGQYWLIPDHDPIAIIPGLLSLKLTANTGAVFGLGKGGQWVFIVVSILAMTVIGHVFWRSKPSAWLMHVALGLILAGALGNLYDRVRFNAVRDLLWLLPGTGLWPWIFNVADVLLLVGVAMLVVQTWQSGRPEQTQRSSPG